MVHLAQNHSIVILGYSLRDPDMGLLLEYLQRHTHLQWDRGAYFLYTDKSLAVAPLVERNINPVLFADRDALWRYVTNLSLNQPAQEPEVQQIVSSAPGHYEKLKSSIAHTLAQAKVMGDLGGHADNVYAALCTGVIADAGGKSAPVPLATLSNRLEGLFHVKPHRAREIAEKAVNLLAVYKLAVRTEDAVQLTEDQSATAMSSVIIELARLIANRVDVRSGIQVKADNELGEFILRFLAEEAFDLIECRLQGNRGHTVRQDERARVLAGKLLGRLTSSARDATCAALLRLLRSPSPDEEPVVVRVVNTVASIEIAMHQVTLSAMTGFDSVATAFVDANILLPTILADHPIHPFYASTIKAARGREVDVVVLREFLNEVISHKTIARAKMEEPELTGKDRFLAKGSDETFQDFLARVAPYTSEDELQKFIVNLGIGVVPKDQYAQNPHLKQLRLTLQSAYASSLGKHSDKTSPLVAHEAVQLAAILQSAAEFRPAWFVTADKGLVTAVREAVAFESDDPTWAQILTCMLTPVEFAHYMTFAGGRQVDWTGYSHALWSSSQSDTMSNFMDYFTDRFLRERNSELTKNLPAALAEVRKLIESAMMPDIERMLGDEGNRIRVFSMLGKFEPKFYEIMAKYKRA
jgi:hypothetical protein